MQQKYLRNAIVLGLLTAIGPFAIDLYLPALPTIGAELGADAFPVQMSLFIFFLSMGFGQIVVGPLSDSLGRKGPLYVGLALFAAGSIGSALAPDVWWLIGFRFLQGLGASAGMVVPRAVVRDLHTGNDAARLMSMLMLVFSVSPILAPLAGSFIIAAAGWRAVFWGVLVIAALTTVLLVAFLPETRPPEERVKGSLRETTAAYGKLLRDWNFVALSLIGGFGIASFFIYLANSPFVLIGHYGLNTWQYSLFFSMNAVAFFGMSQLTGTLSEQFGLRRVVHAAVNLFAAVIAALFVLTALGLHSLPLIAVLLFVGYGLLGLVIPTTSVLAMEDHGDIAGTASALLGTLHFAVGAAAMIGAGLLADGTPAPMIMGIAACAAIAWILALAQRLRDGRRARAVGGNAA